MKAIFNIILCACLAIAISGCHSSKSVSSITDQQDKAQPAKGVKALTQNLDSVVASYKNWNDVEIPIDLEMIQPQEMAVSGKATMVKDQSIYISIRVFGFEAANIYINNDSIHATYKMGKLYIADDLKKLLKGYPVTVGDVQNILLGRAFVLGNGTLNHNNTAVKFADNGAVWIATPHCDIKEVDYNYTFNASTNLLELLTVLIQGANPVLCSYSNHTTTPIGYVAEKLVISASSSKKTIKAAISWNVDKAKWNSGAKPKWKSPKGYKRVEATSLLKGIN